MTPTTTATAAPRVGGTLVAVGKARARQSKLPRVASPARHLGNNLAAFPGTRVLYVGRNISYVLWGNEHIKVHWLDDDLSAPRPDVAPYNLVAIDSGNPRALYRHADVLADEFVLFVPGWAASKRGVERELAKLHRWETTARLELFDPDFQGGVFAGVFTRRPRSDEPPRSDFTGR